MSLNIPYLYVDIEVDDLATFIFIKNKNNAIIELSLGGVENNKDLFYFLIDLLCKGLILLFGNNNRVDLEYISLDNFKIMQAKIELAGIETVLDIKMNTNNIIPGVNIRDIELMNDNSKLEDFIFKVIDKNLIYHINFKLIHKVK